MFYYLNGVVSAMDAQLAVIDCGGVGFACFTTTNTQSYLTVGKTAKLYTYVNIREDAFDIYGFYTQKELNAFKLLISVSGVGPKAALSILSYATVEDLAAAIVTGNEKTLTVVPGVGKKLAQRVMLELKDKLSADASEYETFTGVSVPVKENAGAGKVAEAQAALAALGYSTVDINAALKGVETDELSVEEIIKQALKKTLR